MKKTFSLLLVILMLLSLSACGTSDSPDTDGASGSQSGTFDTLIYGSNDYTRINPAMDEHGEINILIFNGLTAHNGKNEVIPGLAKSWEFDEASCTYTFHLEEG